MNYFKHRCKKLHSAGFSLRDIVTLTKRPREEVYEAIHGTKEYASRKARTPESYLLEIMADIPEGRDPAVHRRIVLANFSPVGDVA